jgi:hypothetical protein
MNSNEKKWPKIVYWISTVWLALGMVSTGIIQLMQHPEELKLMDSLDFPYYLLTIIGFWKLLGVIAVLMPKFVVLKEWAYAGFFFTMSGAIVAHMVKEHGAAEILPALLLLVLTLVSWYFRPVNRRVTVETN